MEELPIRWNGREVVLAVPSLDDHLAKVLLKTGTFYESDLLDFLLPLLSPGDLVVDIGANIGNHTIFFGAIAACDVISYEPMEIALTCLRRSIAVNRLEDKVQVRPFAVGRKLGKASTLSVSEANTGATQLTECSRGNLPLVSLDKELFPKTVKLLKIDVEGMEAQVLAGGLTLLGRDRPMIVCEAWDRYAFLEITNLLKYYCYLPMGVFNPTDTYLFVSDQTAMHSELAARVSNHLVSRSQRQILRFGN